MGIVGYSESAFLETKSQEKTSVSSEAILSILYNHPYNFCAV